MSVRTRPARAIMSCHFTPSDFPALKKVSMTSWLRIAGPRLVFGSASRGHTATVESVLLFRQAGATGRAIGCIHKRWPVGRQIGGAVWDAADVAKATRCNANEHEGQFVGSRVGAVAPVAPETGIK